MGAFTSKATGNWTATGQTTWNEAGVPGTGDTVAIGAHAITLDQTSPASLTCTSITIAAGGTLVIPAATTFALTANVTYSGAGTTTTAAIVVGTGQALTVNGSVTASGAGTAIYGSGTGTLTIANGTSTACSGTSTGYAIWWASTGALAITGNGTATGTNGYCVTIRAAATVTITGNFSTNSVSYYALTVYAGTVTITAASGDALTGSTQGTSFAAMVYAGTLNIVGNMSGTALLLYPVGTGTANWTGSRTLAAGVNCYIDVGSGSTLALSTASPAAALSLANSGNFVISKRAGGTVTKTSAGGTADICNQSAAACAAIIGDGAVSIIRRYGQRRFVGGHVLGA